MKIGFSLALLAGLLSSAGVGQESAQSSGDSTETVATTASIEQFCQSSAGLQFLTDPSVRLERTTFAGPYHSRIVVTRSGDGVAVKLHPPGEVGEAGQAVHQLDLFLIMSTGTQCPQDESVLPVLNVGLAGLSIRTDENGAPDFMFER